MILIFFNILIGIIYLKSGVTKSRKIYQFNIAMKDYKLFDDKYLKIFIPFIIALEICIAIGYLTLNNHISLFVISLLFQLFYILILFKNNNKEFKNNCNCFSLNAPQKVKTRNIATNVFLFVLIIITFRFALQIPINGG